METTLPSPARLRSSVIAVPPLARTASGLVNRDENAKIIRHITQGGVSHLLYGGNALFYHLRLSEYATVLQMLCDLTDSQTCVVPSLGPAYGLMVDQVEVLRAFPFPQPWYCHKKTLLMSKVSPQASAAPPNNWGVHWWSTSSLIVGFHLRWSKNLRPTV